MATKKYLDEDGLVQYTGKVKKAINDASYTHGVTDIDGTTTAPSVDNTVNATANQRNAAFTKNGSSDSFPYYDTTYGNAVAGSKDGLMSRSDKTKLDGIATGAEVNVQSDWNQTTTTADDYIKNKPVVNRVKHNKEQGADALPVLMSHSSSPTNGADLEAGFNSNITFKPSTNELVISGAGGVTVTDGAGLQTSISPGGLSLPSSAKPTLSSTAATTSAAQKLSVTVGGQTSSAVSLNVAESGKYGVVKVDTELSTTSTNTITNAAVSTALNTKADSDDLASVDSGSEGAALIGYTTENTENVTVKDAIDEIYEIIGGGGGGGDSIIDRVEALEDGENLIQGTNVTLTKDTTNHTVTIAAADEKVSQSSDTSTALAIPLLLASGSTPTSPAGAKYNSNLSFKPSTNELKLKASAAGVSITFKDGQITFTNAGMYASIDATNYSGTAAQATADGSGNNIVNTYATKAALDALSNKWTGQFVVLRNSGDTQTMYAALKRIIAAEEEGQEPAAADIALFDFGYIYLIANDIVSEDNIFDEYIKVAGSQDSAMGYYMEKIGTTDAGVDVVSLTPAEINTIWSTTAAAS